MDVKTTTKVKTQKLYTTLHGFTLCQQNGQRTYGGPPPGWGSKPPPNRDCEVFIGRLPRMCFEDELIPLFASMGELYEFRLMLDFSGTNRGYAYAHYTTPEGATKAIKYLNKFEIRPGHAIGVLKSKNNCRLLFGNIKSAIKINNFPEFIRTVTDQVLNVLMFDNFNELKSTEYRISAEVEEAFLGRVPKDNGKFAIVEYENHKAAAVARRVLIPKYGHILAIDWAVPPRERKRFTSGNEIALPPVELPLQSAGQSIFDSNILSHLKGHSKIRPVPELIIQASVMDNPVFMPKMFSTVVHYFKYQLSVCLYLSTDRLEIPLFICKEIERKIVDRITNLESCSQAVQLIFNYFSWYNEKKRFVIDAEVQSFMQEVKLYSDAFVQYVSKRLQFGPGQIPMEDEYYTRTLPLHINILFRIILRASNERLVKLSGITKGLNWLSGVLQNNDEGAKAYIEDIIAHIAKENPGSVEKASAVAKSLFLNAITTHQQGYNSLMTINGDLSTLLKSLDVNKVQINNSMAAGVKQTSVDRIPENSLPSVPVLIMKPSIMNNITAMPRVFYNTLAFFKHTLRICTNTYVWQLNIPEQIYREIERKIIDRISNMENCGEGVQLILNYFAWWVDKKPGKINEEIETLLHEVKIYSNSFLQFIWNKTLSGGQENSTLDSFFCFVLPLKLTLLHQINLMYNNDNPFKFIVRISKGLAWLDDLIENGNKGTKEFITELSRFILELNPSSFEKAKKQGKIILKDLIKSDFLLDVQNHKKASSCSDDSVCYGMETEISEKLDSKLSLNCANLPVASVFSAKVK